MNDLQSVLRSRMYEAMENSDQDKKFKDAWDLMQREVRNMIFFNKKTRGLLNKECIYQSLKTLGRVQVDTILFEVQYFLSY